MTHKALCIAHSATLALLCALSAASCHSSPKPKPSGPRPDTTSLVSRHLQKDQSALQASDRIDTIVTASELAEPVRTETDHIRAAVAAAPAQEVADVANAFAKLIDSQDRKIHNLSGSLDKERQKNIREQTRWLYAAGVALLLAFAATLIFGQLSGLAYGWPLAVLAACCFYLAQAISHPWFVPVFTALCITGIVYAIYIANKQRDKSHKKLNEAKILEQLVPVLDQTYESANEDIKRILDRNIFEPLSNLFTPQQKATVHEIRAQKAKTNP